MGAEVGADVEVEGEVGAEVQVEADIDADIEVAGDIEVEVDAPEVDCDAGLEIQADLNAPIVEAEVGGHSPVTATSSRTCCCLAWGVVFLIFFLGSLGFCIYIWIVDLPHYKKASGMSTADAAFHSNRAWFFIT